MTVLISLSVVALVLGILAHALKQLITSRRTPGTPITLSEYLGTYWPETLLGMTCSVGLFLGYPEIGTWFPPLGQALNLPTSQTPLGGFLCGFIGNSLADVLGGRLTRVVNG